MMYHILQEITVDVKVCVGLSTRSIVVLLWINKIQD